MSRQALENTKNKLKEEIELAKNLLSEQNKNFTKARSAAVTKNFSKNNTTAFPDELRSVIARAVSSATRKQDEKIERRMEEVGAKVTQANAKMKDINRGSAANVLDSALAGRPIPNAVSRDRVAVTYNNANAIYPESFYGQSIFAPHNAAYINNLHPIVRDRVAQAMRSFVDEYREQGYDIKIVEGGGRRSLAQQKALQNSSNAVTRRVAAKGLSWHNFGAAIDINLYDLKRGVFIQRAQIKYYTGIARQHFSKYDMFNRLDGTWGIKKIVDPNHFIPTELWGKSIQSQANVLLNSNGTINENGLDRLLAGRSYSGVVT
jgi:hypothetical protein